MVRRGWLCTVKEVMYLVLDGELRWSTKMKMKEHDGGLFFDGE